MKEESAGVIPVFLGGAVPTFLVIQQHHGHWGFPKGHLQYEESALQAAIRELLEEVHIHDIKIVPDHVYVDRYVVDRDGKSVQKTVSYFFGVTTNKNVSLQSEEISNFAWLPLADSLTRLSYEGQRRALSAFADYIRSDGIPHWLAA